MTAIAVSKSRRRTRTNGEGSIPRKRADGTWEARYTAGFTPDGKQIRRSVYGRTRAVVADKLKARLAETERGAVVLADTGKLTLVEYARTYLLDRASELGPGTQMKLGSYLTILRTQAAATGSMTELKPAQLERMYAALARRYAPSTVHHLSVFVNQVLRRAVRHELLRTHPGLVAELPRMQQEPVAKALTQDEVVAVLTEAHRTRYYPLFAVIAELGLRHGEALGLQWGDLDLDAGTLSIKRAVVARSGTPAVSHPKTKAAARTLYLVPELVEVLAGQQARLKLEGYPVGNGAWVFPSETGGMLGQNNIRRVWARLLARAGVFTPYRIHDLRHTFVSRLIEGGADPKTTADLAGHADPRQTLSVYTHTHAERRKATLLNTSSGALKQVRRGGVGVEDEKDEAS